MSWISRGSGIKTVDGVIYAYPCLISAIQIKTDGSNDATAVLYDNASAGSGEVIWDGKIKGSDEYGGRNWAFPRQCNNGIYLDLTGTGASAIVEYIVR